MGLGGKSISSWTSRPTLECARDEKKEIKNLKKQEKLQKRAGAMDWHHGNFASRKLHKQDAAYMKR